MSRGLGVMQRQILESLTPPARRRSRMTGGGSSISEWICT